MCREEGGAESVLRMLEFVVIGGVCIVWGSRKVMSGTLGGSDRMGRAVGYF